MAALSAILTKQFRTRFKDQAGKADILIIDATTKIVPQYDAETTDNPIEDGPDVTDHVRVKPIRVTIEGEMSEDPLTLKSELSGLTTAAGAAVGQVLKPGWGATVGAVLGSSVGAALLGSDAANNPATVARKILENMILKKVRFTLIDKNRKFEDMVLTSLSFPKDAKTGRKLVFQATAKQLNIVVAETTQISKVSSKQAHSIGASKKLGPQTGVTEADPSILRGVTDKLGFTTPGG